MASHKQSDTVSSSESAEAVDIELLKLRQKTMDYVSDIDTPVKTLLDFKMERKFKLDEEERKGMLHRMVIISKMYHSNYTEIGQYYEKFLKETTNQLQTEGATGLLLLYPQHCVHVIESSHDLLLELVKDLRRDEDSGKGNMEKAKIVIISHDIPHRVYQAWSYRTLDIQAPNLDDFDPSEEPSRIVLDMLLQLLKLGAYLNKQPKMALKSTMETLHEKVPELLPQQDYIHYLIERDDECTTTPEEHLNKYQKPYDVTLASELTWPMPVRLFPYN